MERTLPTAWLDALEPAAPRITGAYRSYEGGKPVAVRRAVRHASGSGSIPGLVAELAALAEAMAALVQGLPEGLLASAGGEADWNLAQAIGHDASARVGLVLAASLAASGRWPADAPTVVPGVAGPADATRDDLLRVIARSQRLIERTSRAIVGHEGDACPLDHPLVGRLRCGEWVAFAGVHDLMHLDQLHGIAARAAVGTSAGVAS